MLQASLETRTQPWGSKAGGHPKASGDSNSQRWLNQSLRRIEKAGDTDKWAPTSSGPKMPSLKHLIPPKNCRSIMPGVWVDSNAPMGLPSATSLAKCDSPTKPLQPLAAKPPRVFHGLTEIPAQHLLRCTPQISTPWRAPVRHLGQPPDH